MTTRTARARSRRVATSALTLGALALTYVMAVGAPSANAVSPKQPPHPLVLPQGKAIPTSANVPTDDAFVPIVADFDGDSLADLALVTTQGVVVLNTDGTDFTAPDVPFYGSVETVAADFNGDGYVDLIAVNSNSVWVELSNGTQLTAPLLASHVPFYGARGMLTGHFLPAPHATELAAINNENWYVLGASAGAPTPSSLRRSTATVPRWRRTSAATAPMISWR